MLRNDSPIRRRTAAEEVQPDNQRSTRRLQGVLPEFGLLPTATRRATQHTLSSTSITRVSSASLPRRSPRKHRRLVSHFDRVASFNPYDDACKLGNFYFRLEDGARTWIENREGTLRMWRDFFLELLKDHASTDGPEWAKNALKSRVQLPN
ncbi:hypothetical protein HPB48_002427 [Haemaphysalis longicornis]|uniref:Uncharacterized protein n=1 Tax=Haemaphysalis longicornis TaxID=44386 RepID=A0A9J6GUD2_HAELO|nr:hypothetical protein HPB48_002427 [Haemaphysalis longicornis]